MYFNYLYDYKLVKEKHENNCNVYSKFKESRKKKRNK
jgi:hypothetical protein